MISVEALRIETSVIAKAPCTDGDTVVDDDDDDDDIYIYIYIYVSPALPIKRNIQ